MSSFSFPLLCRTLQRFPRAAGGPDGPRPRGEANLERTPFVGVLVHRVFCGGLAATGTSLELLMARTLLLRTLLAQYVGAEELFTTLTLGSHYVRLSVSAGTRG